LLGNRCVILETQGIHEFKILSGEKCRVLTVLYTAEMSDACLMRRQTTQRRG